jgi:hypothetical protein
MIAVCSVLLMLAGGCVTKSEAQRQAREAYLAGQNQALTAAAANAAKDPNAPITVRGDVANNTIPWADGLTLANVLMDANYQRATGPSRLTITRDGQTTAINVRDFLQGKIDDIPLQPGDRIDLAR